MKSGRLSLILLFVITVLFMNCSAPVEYDLIIRNGMIYDGSGHDAVSGDLAVNGDRIMAIGRLGRDTGKEEINVNGLAVAPGFINMLSWANESLIADGRSMSDIKQGVTLEVLGEGTSMGPLSVNMKREYLQRQAGDAQPVPWTTLGEYLEFLETNGISPNVASFIGHTTVRIHEIGYEDRPPTPVELNRMQDLVRQAMEEGAVGMSTALIYTPAFYADTEELIALARVVADYNGLYISHIRSEGNTLLESAEELFRIVRETGVAAEFYHLKAAGKANWSKMDELIDKINRARENGLKISADMYTYPAGATGLNAAMPPWVQEGGHRAWIERLKNAKIRERVIREMTTPTDKWENLMLQAGSPDKVLLVGFRNPDLRHLVGKSLAEAAELSGKSAAETAVDLVIEDDSRVETIYFLMSEDNIKKQIRQPWVSFCSDAASISPEGSNLTFNPHPRTYGSFARLLGRYVREKNTISLAQAIRQLAALPAENLKLHHRGRLSVGNFADVVVFDPQTIQDHATFEKPHQLATGMIHVFVNGVQVLKNGNHTGATPGRVVRGPGWTGGTK